jgi:retron-type reverse transcriptase
MFYFLFRSGKLYWTYLLQQLEMPKSSYEPIFLDCSYGFRPGRGCHDAKGETEMEAPWR